MGSGQISDELIFAITSQIQGFLKDMQQARSEIDKTTTAAKKGGQDIAAGVSQQLSAIDKYYQAMGTSSKAVSEKMSVLQKGVRDMTANGLDPMSASVQRLVAQHKELEGSLTRQGSMLNSNILKFAALAAVIRGIGVEAKKGLDFDIFLERSNVAFTVMLKSADKAKTLMTELTALQQTTPIGLREGAEGAKQLLAYGFGTKDMVDNLKMLQTVASAVDVPLKDMVYVYGTLRAQGRAYARDLMQFAMRGIPIYEALSETMGVPVKQLKKMTEEGKIGFEQVEAAMKHMTETGGIFADMLNKQMETLGGRLQLLGRQVQTSLGIVMQPSAGPLGDFAVSMKKMLQEQQPAIMAIGENIGKALGSALKGFEAALPAILAVLDIITRIIATLGNSTIGSIIRSLISVLALLLRFVDYMMQVNPAFNAFVTTLVAAGIAMRVFGISVTAAMGPVGILIGLLVTLALTFDSVRAAADAAYLSQEAAVAKKAGVTDAEKISKYFSSGPSGAGMLAELQATARMGGRGSSGSGNIGDMFSELAASVDSFFSGTKADVFEWSRVMAEKMKVPQSSLLEYVKATTDLNAEQKKGLDAQIAATKSFEAAVKSVSDWIARLRGSIPGAAGPAWMAAANLGGLTASDLYDTATRGMRAGAGIRGSTARIGSSGSVNQFSAMGEYGTGETAWGAAGAFLAAFTAKNAANTEAYNALAASRGSRGLDDPFVKGLLDAATKKDMEVLEKFTTDFADLFVKTRDSSGKMPGFAMGVPESIMAMALDQIKKLGDTTGRGRIKEPNLLDEEWQAKVTTTMIDNLQLEARKVMQTADKLLADHEINQEQFTRIQNNVSAYYAAQVAGAAYVDANQHGILMGNAQGALATANGNPLVAIQAKHDQDLFDLEKENIEKRTLLIERQTRTASVSQSYAIYEELKKNDELYQLKKKVIEKEMENAKQAAMASKFQELVSGDPKFWERLAAGGQAAYQAGNVGGAMAARAKGGLQGTEVGTLMAGGDPLQMIVGGAVDFLKSIENVGKVLNPIKTLFESMRAVLEPLLNAAFKPLVQIIEQVGQALGPMLTPFIQVVQTAFSVLYAVVEPLIAVLQMVSQVFVWLADNVIVPVGNVFVSMANGIADILNTLFGWLGVHIQHLDRLLTSAERNMQAADDEAKKKQIADALTSVSATLDYLARKIQEQVEKQIKAQQDLYEVGAISGAQYKANVAAANSQLVGQNTNVLSAALQASSIAQMRNMYDALIQIKASLDSGILLKLDAINATLLAILANSAPGTGGAAGAALGAPQAAANAAAIAAWQKKHDDLQAAFDDAKHQYDDAVAHKAWLEADLYNVIFHPDWIDSAVQDMKDKRQKALDAAQALQALGSMPSFAVGAWNIPKTMPAVVHQGEMIMPRTFAQDFRDNAGGQGPVVNVYVQGSVVAEDDLADKIATAIYRRRQGGHITVPA